MAHALARRLQQHSCIAPGVNGDFATYPGSGYQTIVLSNRGHPHAANVADYIGARLPAGRLNDG